MASASAGDPREGRDLLVRCVALFVLGVVLAGCSLLNHPWRKADDYVAGLRCNMSEGELRTYSERYPQLEIRNPDDPELLIASKGNTQILLWLGAAEVPIRYYRECMDSFGC